MSLTRIGRVLHCIPSLGGGGSERQLGYLARDLAGAGWDVHVASITGGPNLAVVEASGVEVHRIAVSGNHDPRVFSRLLELIRAIRPSLVQCWLRQMEIVGGVAAMASGIPWLLSERSSVEAYPPGIKHYVRVRLAAFAAAIVSNSCAGDDYWSKRVGQSVPRYVVPNALPLDEIALVSPATDAEARVDEGQPLILYAGRLDESKNVPTLLDALRLIDTEADVRAVLCGDGPMRAEIDALIASHHLAGRVQAPGYVTNLWSLMKRATVLVSPSRFEGSPNVVLEAMACGCPLVLSDIPAHREILDEHSALFVKLDDPNAIATAIRSLLVDPAAGRRRADTASARAQRYALPAIVRQYVNVYDEVITRHRIARGRAS